MASHNVGGALANKAGGVRAPIPARIQSLARARAILDVLAGAEGRWVTLGDIARGTGLLKTTTFNLITGLCDIDMAEHDRARGAYRLGLQALVYGRSVERRIDLVEHMRPYLTRLCALTRETVNLAIPCPTDVMIVESMEGSQNLRVSSYAGTRAAYHSTACGRALLAHRPAAERRQILTLQPLTRATPATTTDIEAIEAILAGCRRDGYVCEIEENETGAACVAAALTDAAGTAIAAVSVAGPLPRMTEDARARHGRLLIETLAEAARELQPRGGEAGAA